MANYCILRTAKLKTDGNVAASIQHALRTRETPNADPKIENWTNLNVKGEDGKSHIPPNVLDKAMARYRATLPKKIGKGRVPCVELLMTVSPEVLARKDFNPAKYMNDCDRWARETFGQKNVFLVVHHWDESTPHSSVFLVPKVLKKYKDGHTEEVLAAKQWLGGREKLSLLQDNFWEVVGKKYGLDRGIRNSRAKHQTVKKYYSRLNQVERELTEFSQDLVENVPKNWTGGIDKEKLGPYLKNQIEKLKPMMKQLVTASQVERRYRALQSSFDEELDRRTAAVRQQYQELLAENKALRSNTEELIRLKRTIANMTAEQLRKLADKHEREQATRTTRKPQNQRNDEWER